MNNQFSNQVKSPHYVTQNPIHTDFSATKEILAASIIYVPSRLQLGHQILETHLSLLQ